MNDLRKIIVNATSEMLDNPDEHGIYPTTKFYERLEADITEYMQMHPNPVNVYALAMQLAKTGGELTPALQNAIASYLDRLSSPKTNHKAIEIALFGKEVD